jgi:tryptophan synthase alpha chain
MARTMRPDQSILVNLSGRGDKDIGTVADLSNADFYCRPSCRVRRSRAASSVKHAGDGSTRMSRITATLAALKAQKRTALIPYVTAGFPYPDITPDLMHGMVAAGADILELGVPVLRPERRRSRDPESRRQGPGSRHRPGTGAGDGAHLPPQGLPTPVVLMGYANPIERYDQRHPAAPAPGSAFVQAAAQAGVDGLLIVDYPPEECTGIAADLRRHGMDLIFLLAPTSTEQRMQQVAEVATGYVYYVSLKGVTGAGTLDIAAVESMLPRIRQHVQIPVGVGFGIRDAASACAIAAWPMQWSSAAASSS